MTSSGGVTAPIGLNQARIPSLFQVDFVSPTIPKHIIFQNVMFAYVYLEHSGIIFISK